MPTCLDKHSLVLRSPAKRVRAELSVETVWIGATVYPESPVWRVWYDGRPVVDTSTIGLLTPAGPLAYGMRLLKATRHRPQTGIGPGRAIQARFAARDGRELAVTLRVTDLSAFCSVRQPRSKATTGQPLSLTCFPEGSVLLGGEETLSPQVRFTPSGKGVAFWRHGLEQHLVFFDRPGDLAERRFGALEHIEALDVPDGRRGCEHLFLSVPFTKAALPAPVFGDAVTAAYRAAFGMMLAEGSEKTDDLRILRGEPGEFAVAARRQGDVWRVGGVTADARTLTVRFEDLWLKTPPELRASQYTVEILRDPTGGESGDSIEERFEDQAPDVRVALDLKANGGFLLTFRPQFQHKITTESF